LLRCIGGGSYGGAWLARNALGAYRAVKIVHRHTFEHDRPFEQEFGGIQNFEPISRSHEGLVDLLQVGRNDPEGYFYYVMELADDANVGQASSLPVQRASLPAVGSGGMVEATEEELTARLPAALAGRMPTPHPETYLPRTLKRELQLRGHLPFEDCVRLGLALTSALSHLHKHGLVHRDIKPSNIMFVDGVPKLADVGLVALVGEARSYVGTEGFIPPEGPGSPQADLYSLGIMLCVMSTGKSHSDFPEPLPDLSSDPDHARWLEFNSVIHKACRAEASDAHRDHRTSARSRRFRSGDDLGRGMGEKPPQRRAGEDQTAGAPGALRNLSPARHP
jgi:serine/threonine protein kinase